FYYGPLLQDRQQLLSYNFAYQIPAPVSSVKAMKAVLGDWTLSGIGIITTGAPVNPICTSTAAFPTSDPTLPEASAITSSAVSGAYRCGVNGDPKAFTQNFFNNFNTGAFGMAALGTFGNAGLGILRQPTWWNFDASLDKKIAIKERLAVRLRFQAFNVFN